MAGKTFVACRPPWGRAERRRFRWRAFAVWGMMRPRDSRAARTRRHNEKRLRHPPTIDPRSFPWIRKRFWPRTADVGGGGTRYACEGRRCGQGGNVHVTRPDNFDQLRSFLRRLLQLIPHLALEVPPSLRRRPNDQIHLELSDNTHTPSLPSLFDPGS